MAAYNLQAMPLVPLKYLALFGTGAFIMRSAGCTINDMWDRNLDKAVGEKLCFIRDHYSPGLTFFPGFPERTKIRPLARGDLTWNQAFGFLALQMSAGLCVLLQLNLYRWGL